MAVVSLRTFPASALLAVAMLAAGCSQGPPQQAPAGPSGSAPAAGSSSHASSAGSHAPTSPAAAAATSPAAPTLPSWPDTPRTTTSSGPAATLTRIAIGRHATFDRLVFGFSGGLPGYDVRYVSNVVADGSGQPVTLQGHAFLHIVFHPMTLHQTYSGPSTLTPSDPVLLQLKAAGDFEGYLSFGAGLRHHVGFNVFTLTGPDRVVIDIAHG